MPVTILAGLLAMVAGLVITWGLGPAGPRPATAGTTGEPLTGAAFDARADRAIVDVTSILGNGGSEAMGTGIVLTPTGLVLTNNHVIDNATSIRVADVANGRPYLATVVGYDRSADVAVLQLRGAAGLTPANIGDSSQVTTGEPVTALGNAGGAGGTPVAAPGAVMALNQSVVAADTATGSSELLSGLIESNADVQPGDSGGPLLNAAGQVIAIDSAAGMRSEAGTDGTRGYSIPINRAIRLATQIRAGRASASVHIGTTANLGVVVSTAGAAQGNLFGGAVISAVTTGSPAAEAGLAGGDVITSVGGRSVTSASSFDAVLNRYHPGDGVGINWTDPGGNSHHSTVVLTRGPAA